MGLAPFKKVRKLLGGSPGLVVMEGDSWSEGREFKSHQCMLDGHLFILICCKNCIDVCVKKTKKIMKKRPGMALFKKERK